MWLYRRSGTSPQTIFQCSSLKIRWIDRTCSQPTAGGLWSWALGRGRMYVYGDCRSTQCCMGLCVLLCCLCIN